MECRSGTVSGAAQLNFNLLGLIPRSLLRLFCQFRFVFQNAPELAPGFFTSLIKNQLLDLPRGSGPHRLQPFRSNHQNGTMTKNAEQLWLQYLFYKIGAMDAMGGM
jgi:hypothetical protein